MRHSTLGAAVVVAVALLACKQESSSSAPSSEAPTTAVPTAAPTPTPATTPEAVREPESDDQPQSKSGVPSEGNSKPPSVAEWNAVGEITVRHSTPLGCETKLVREWLRVSCRTTPDQSNQIQSVKLTRGSDSGGIPPFTKTGVASIVTRVKPGIDADWTFAWSQWGARKLTVRWPNGAPRPTYEFDQSAPK